MKDYSTKKAQEIQDDILKQMTPTQRIALMARLSKFAQKLSRLRLKE